MRKTRLLTLFQVNSKTNDAKLQQTNKKFVQRLQVNAYAVLAKFSKTFTENDNANQTLADFRNLTLQYQESDFY